MDGSTQRHPAEGPHRPKNGRVKNCLLPADAVSKTGFPVRTDTQNQGWLRFPNPGRCGRWTLLRQRFAPRGGQQPIPFFAAQGNFRCAGRVTNVLGIGRADRAGCPTDASATTPAPDRRQSAAATSLSTSEKSLTLRATAHLVKNCPSLLKCWGYV